MALMENVRITRYRMEGLHITTLESRVDLTFIRLNTSDTFLRAREFWIRASGAISFR